MAERKIKVCDKCASIEATSYTITTEGDTYIVDLCHEHAAPVMDAAQAGVKQKKRGPRKRTVKTDRPPTPSFSGS